MNLLLDTCTFLWLASSPSQLSPAAVDALNESSNALLLSDVSIWEITMKHAAGKLPLPEAPRNWIPKQMNFFQLHRREIEVESLYLSGELPWTHRDPFDRLLAAQSILHKLTIVTPDKPIADLGAITCW